MATEARPQRRANGDISTRAQQRYGNVLPPSLRRGLRRVSESQDASEVDNDIQRGKHTSPYRSATRRDGHQVNRLERQKHRDQREESPRNTTGVIERPVAVGTVRPLPGQSAHGSARSNVSAESTSPRNRADGASRHSRGRAYSPSPPPAEPFGAHVEESVHEFDDVKIIVRQRSLRSEQKKRAGRPTRRPEVMTYAKRIDLGRLDADEPDESAESTESTESAESIASTASIASDSMPVYLPPEPTGPRGHALGADANEPSMPVDGSLRLDSQVSIERYCIYPSTYFQVHSQKESALPTHPDASLIRSPGVDRPKHVGTFEWIHMEQSVLDVFHFKRLVLEHLKVGPNARTLIAQSIDKFELDTGQPDSGPTFAKPHCKRLWGGEEDEQQSVLMLMLPLVYLHDSKGGRHIVPMGKSDNQTTNHRTLLQMLFPRMGSNVHGQQARYQSGGHSGYLHVTQLWCIMLDGGNEETLITCSTLTEATLRGDSISSTTVPPSIKRPGLLGNHVEVVDGDGRMWMLKRESCRTWFEFEFQLNEICEETSERVCYRHEGTPVLPQDWPKLMRDHQEAPLRIYICSGALSSAISSRRASKGEQVPDPVPASDNDPIVTARNTLDAAQVRTTTSDSVEDFLVFPSGIDTKLYEACERMTAAQAFFGPYRRMQSVKMPAASADPADLTSTDVSPDIKGTDSSEPRGSEEEATKNGLYRSLMKIIWPLTHLFAPSYRSEEGSRTSLKFWGAMQAFAISAIRVYLARGAKKEDFHTFPGSAYAPWRLVRVVEKLLSYQYSREILVEDEPVPGSNVRMPQDFRLAYREVILAFIHGTEPDLAVSRRHFLKAQKLLKSSFYEVLKDIPRPPLLTREAVGAEGLLALIVRHCTNSTMPSGADLITLFSQQITALEQEVWSGEPSRAPLKSLRILRNELAAAGIVLQSQLDVLETLEQSMCWRVQYDDYEDQPQRIVTASVEAAKDRLDILPSLEALVAELRAECEAQSADIEDWRSNTQVLVLSLTCHYS
ncbi:hypothetical protein LTS10_012878 [Elasticomyces elasticus]|nr:hypothetical protein LTS10_012878 [Elasticomyces elasticus]